MKWRFIKYIVFSIANVFFIITWWFDDSIFAKIMTVIMLLLLLLEGYWLYVYGHEQGAKENFELVQKIADLSNEIVQEYEKEIKNKNELIAVQDKYIKELRNR